MSNLLKNNAYHVLGFETSATPKDVQRRFKEIEKLLQIDGVPEYDFDFGIFEGFRTADAAKEAAQRLASPKKRIQEYFFWFSSRGEHDRQAFEALRAQKYQKALDLMKADEVGDQEHALLRKKNLALLYSLLMFREHREDWLADSLTLWKEILESEAFWSEFAKSYRAADEFGASSETIAEFRAAAIPLLADLYAELGSVHGNDSYVAEFSQAFGVRGEKTGKEILNPLFAEMSGAIECLENMNVSEDGMLDREESAAIKKHITTVQDCCNRMIELGLYDDSQSKVMRDRAAAAIRSIVIDIHNNLDDVPKAEQLLMIAMRFAGTPGMEHKIQKDLDQLKANKRHADLTGPISELVLAKKYEEALSVIDRAIERNGDDEAVLKIMAEKKKEVLALRSLVIFTEGKKLFDAERYDEALPLLRKAASVIYESIEIFDIHKEAVDSWLETTKHNVKNMTSENFDKVSEVHAKILKVIDQEFDERWEQIAIKTLVGSYFYAGVGEIIKNKKPSIWERVAGFLAWVVGFAVIRGIFELLSN